MTEQEIELYHTRWETAVLVVGRRVANAFGIKHTEQMTSQQVHEALIDKREAWQNDGGQRGDDRFEKRLMQLTARFGKQTPFHDAFDEAFRRTITDLPLHRVEPYLTQLASTCPELLDPLGYGYLADILRSSSTTESANSRRATLLLDRLKAKAVRQAERAKQLVTLAQVAISEGPCLPPLTLAIADEIAEAVGLIQEGRYALDDKKKSGLVAFHQTFKKYGLVQGTLKELNKFFGQRYGVEVLVEAYGKTTTGQTFTGKVGKQIKLRGLRPTNNDE